MSRPPTQAEDRASRESLENEGDRIPRAEHAAQSYSIPGETAYKWFRRYSAIALTNDVRPHRRQRSDLIRRTIHILGGDQGHLSSDLIMAPGVPGIVAGPDSADGVVLVSDPRVETWAGIFRVVLFNGVRTISVTQLCQASSAPGDLRRRRACRACRFGGERTIPASAPLRSSFAAAKSPVHTSLKNLRRMSQIVMSAGRTRQSRAHYVPAPRPDRRDGRIRPRADLQQVCLPAV